MRGMSSGLLSTRYRPATGVPGPIDQPCPRCQARPRNFCRDLRAAAAKYRTRPHPERRIPQNRP